MPRNMRSAESRSLLGRRLQFFLGDSRGISIIEAAQLPVDQVSEPRGWARERPFGNKPLQFRIVVERHDAVAFKISNELLPRGTRLRCWILKVQSLVAETNSQWSEGGAEDHRVTLELSRDPLWPPRLRLFIDPIPPRRVQPSSPDAQTHRHANRRSETCPPCLV